MLSEGAISIGTDGLAGPISLAASGLRANRAAPIERVDQMQKKICWMKKMRWEMPRPSCKSMRIARITRISS